MCRLVASRQSGPFGKQCLIVLGGGGSAERVGESPGAFWAAEPPSFHGKSGLETSLSVEPLYVGPGSGHPAAGPVAEVAFVCCGTVPFLLLSRVLVRLNWGSAAYAGAFSDVLPLGHCCMQGRACAVSQGLLREPLHLFLRFPTASLASRRFGGPLAAGAGEGLCDR